MVLCAESAGPPGRANRGVVIAAGCQLARARRRKADIACFGPPTDVLH
jgi:hypothetical protein